ncbi:hypothetical protein OH76DRAFT_360729 [Lentinus brumalis]|uniref:Uncharacterized protein n=1 Tax=Lentinus brumalis TaxID=2498619 RepID=A0A371CJ59_9APHY|nr:hypothetical protein OH76DRAFT_360729 [Polyporus brumalis]
MSSISTGLGSSAAKPRSFVLAQDDSCTPLGSARPSRRSEAQAGRRNPPGGLRPASAQPRCRGRTTLGKYDVYSKQSTTSTDGRSMRPEMRLMPVPASILLDADETSPARCCGDGVKADAWSSPGAAP